MDLDEVAFIDVEVDRSGRPLVLGGVRGSERLRIDFETTTGKSAARSLEGFVEGRAVGGHNVRAFDLPLLRRTLGFETGDRPVLDTLGLSMLADPARPSHALDKPLAVERGAVPDPVADAERARELARQCVRALASLDGALLALWTALLDAGETRGLAMLCRDALGLDAAAPSSAPLAALGSALSPELSSRLCRVRLIDLLGALDREGIADDDRLPLAVALGYIAARAHGGGLGGPPSPAIARLPRFNERLTHLMGPLCPDHGCALRLGCEVHHPFAEEILETHFELPAFRPHQKDIILSILGGRHPLAILPTGGGKSLCYQLPAIHGAKRLFGLTVVVSPLQALMADQVRSLSVRYPQVCFINSTLLLDDRQKNLAGVRAGTNNILYIGPEQLRNTSILRLLRNRPPLLWVIDEAHCISQWGHSFRTDYTHLPRAIAAIHGERSRPLLALFTATATAEVIDDMRGQVEKGLGVTPELMSFGAKRENLAYEVVRVDDDEHKFRELVRLLSEVEGGSRLVYCATVRGATALADRLRESGIACALYHGRLSNKQKADELERFLDGRARTVVATSAFGMGIDKADIRLVVHHDVPGSLEDYVQETGRAGRDGEPARCALLYAEEDLDTQFFLKTMGQVLPRDIRYVFKALRARARRVAAPGGSWAELWVNAEDLFVEEDLEEALDWSRDVLATKLKLVLYHLEADGVVERLENRTRAFGIYPLEPAVELALEKLAEPRSPATERVLRFLYQPERPPRLSILDVADECGLRPAEAFREIQKLERLGLVGQDLGFEVTLSRGVALATRELAERRLAQAEALLGLAEDPDDAPVLHLRSAALGVARATGQPIAPHQLLDILRALRRQGLLRLDKWAVGRYRVRFDPGFVAARERLRDVRRTARALLDWVEQGLEGKTGRSLHAYVDVNRFLGESRELFDTYQSDVVVETCLLLHHLEAWELSDPPVVFEISMKVRMDPSAQVGRLHARRAREQHEHDVGLVHMVREYATLPPGQRDAYVDDYFTLPRAALLDRYFRGRKGAIRRPVSPNTEARIIEGLTDAQREAVTAEERALLVVAGPGSGKTHTVVRRIVHLVRARQVRPEQILALSFNRAAAAELRARLEDALGPRGRWVDVRTFHSLALRLTGADLAEERDAEERLVRAIVDAAALLEGPETDAEGLVESREERRRRILGPVHHVLVDEYQDLDADQYRLLRALVALDPKKGPADRTERSVYVVGDDDQAIYGFRNASVEFLRAYEEEFAARRVCLVENFRSNQRIVLAASRFIRENADRLKTAADEQIRAAPGAADGGDRAVRRFRYPDLHHVSTHLAFVAERSLEAGDGTLALLARTWSELDGVRLLLEERGIDFVLHHRDYHRPVHRRHPADRVIRELWRDRTVIEGPAVDAILALLTRWNRTADEPPVRELLRLAAEIDAERNTVLAEGGPKLAPMTTHELADALLLGSRDAARESSRESSGARVHLSTFHGAKGLEFDKVVVLPARRPKNAEALAEERRLYYVAMTRARSELVLATLGDSDELAREIDAPVTDMGAFAARLPPVRGGLLDCDPGDVQLRSVDLGRAQGVISKLREGEPLELEWGTDRLRLLHGDKFVGILSTSGQERLAKLRERCRGDLRARVHEIFVHLDKKKDGSAGRRSLVVLPTFRVLPRGR